MGDLSDFEGGQIRAARFGVVGTLNFKRPWRYTVFAMTHAYDKGFDVDTDEEFSFADYRLDIPLPADLTLSVGKQKEPISMERLMGLAYLPMQERGAFIDALLPSRNHGVVLSGAAASDNVSWAVGAFNNWIDSGESFSDTANVFVGRTTWAPAVFQNESNLFHVGLGLRYSDLEAAGPGSKNAGIQQCAALRRYRGDLGRRPDDLQPGGILAQWAVLAWLRVRRDRCQLAAVG